MKDKSTSSALRESVSGPNSEGEDINPSQLVSSILRIRQIPFDE